MQKRLLTLLVMIACLSPAAFAGAKSHPDRALRARLAAYAITPLDPGPAPPPEKVRLGRLLFFDKVLSGNRDIACATCHHPLLMTDDALSLSIGTKGVGLGPDRVKPPDRPFVARNATDVFDRGAPEWTTMFWDFRVAQTGLGQFRTPAGGKLPAGLDSVLAAQAMFPVTGRDEMRGLAGDAGNELATLADSDFPGIWAGLTARLLAIPAYRRLFAEAYPGVPASSIGFQHAANAIAAFEAAAFTLPGSPWDRYVAGDNRALEPDAKRGALLFYGRAGCVKCHAGNLLTDQQAHDLAVPQLGPGKPPGAPLDFGCGAVDGVASHKFAFRTPPLRNVAVTGPWMHDGAYTTLEGAVRHHLDPAGSLLNYDRTQLAPALQPTVIDDPAALQAMLANLDPLLRNPPRLSDADVDDLLAFLGALTGPGLASLDDVIPESVPSGVPVDRAPTRDR
jgi:cytochrome c peroxidase